MIDSNFRSAGYADNVEHNPDQEMQSKQKTYAPVAFCSKILYPPQLNLSIYSKDFLATYIGIPEFAHILREARKPTIVLTSKKRVARFFQTKAIPLALCNACDYVPLYNFKKVLLVGSIYTEADLPFRLELNVTEKILLGIFFCSKVFRIQANNENEPEKQTP